MIHNKKDEFRKCSECKTNSSKSNFYKDRSTKDGVRAMRKVCSSG